MNYNEAPTFLRAADAHALAADNTSLFDDIGDFIGKTPSFLAVSVASGINSFYNSGVAIGNIFEDEEYKSEMRDTGEWISSYDEDLGKYYEEHKTAADITGFIAGSLVPGTAAVKGLNAAQKAMQVAAKGQVGSNFSRATKLLAPSMETYVKREAAVLASRSQAFSFMHQNSLKALAAGTQQGVLEAVAFEAAVAATMFKSPLLEDMDFGDIVKNGLVGVAFGGAIGGGIAAAGTYFGVRGLVRNADARAMPFQRSTQLSGQGEHLKSDRIIVAAEDRAFLESFEPDGLYVLSQKRAAGETGESLSQEAVANEVARLQRLREDNMKELANEIREGVRGLTNKDDELGNLITSVFDKLGNSGIQKLLFNARQIVRAGDKTELDQLAKKLVREGIHTDVEAAKVALKDSMVGSHIRLHSGTVGEQIAGDVGYMRLADKYQTKKYDQMVRAKKYSTKDKTDFRKIKDPEEAELRWIRARADTKPLKPSSQIGAYDLPTIERALVQGLDEINLINENKGVIKLVGKQEIQDYLEEAKLEVLQVHKARKGVTTDELEVITDVRKDWIEGTNTTIDKVRAMHAQSSYAEELGKHLGREVSPLQLHSMPRFAQVTYDTREITDETGMILQGMELIKHREKLAVEATDRYFAKFAGNQAELFPKLSEALFRKVWRGDTGAGLLTNAGGAYGSLSSMASFIGDLTAELTRKRITALTEGMTPQAQKLLTKPDDAVRFSGINALVSNAKVQYVLDETGENLIPYQLKQYLDEIDAGKTPNYPEFPEGTRTRIPLETEEVRAAVAKHIEMDETRNVSWGELHAVQGNTDEKLRGVFRPIRPDPRDYKHVAFVKDETLVGVGHTRMIFAQSGAELENMIRKIDEIGKYKVYTKQQSERFYEARGQWEYEKTLHENYIDTDLKSRGISSNFIPPTDPQKVVDQWLQHHVRAENALIKHSVLAKYEKETNELKRLADQWEQAQGSRVGTQSAVDALTSSSKNPYTAMLKAMLNVTKVEEHAWLTTANQALDRVISRAWNSVGEVFQKGPSPERIEEINKIMEGIGFQSAYTDAAMTLMANSKVPRGVLSGFVRKSNAFLTATVLRLDAFNALNNLLGNTVLYSAEMQSVIKAIREGSEAGAGELAKLADVMLPGVDDAILSPQKLMAGSIERLFGDQGPALRAAYKERGLLPDLTDQFYKALDSMTLTGMESVSDINKLSTKLGQHWENFVNKGEKVTGNRFAEEFNRLIAADTMKQITELAVKHGVLDEKAAWAYVGTFSKRVNGVIRAAERPLMFQGPIGQAMGLFQSYQVNLLQQLFRHVGEGRGKTVALMAGMQGSIYGASSLPGMNFINSTLVGNASGNPEHYDLYSAAYNVFGQTGADWLMYGAPSNLLNASLYTRGDTNPRVWHVVPNPTNPSEIPFISAFAKVFGTVKEGVGQVNQGAEVWQSFLRGVEHLGLSRPLAGFAQTARALSSDDMQVFATQRNGSIAGSNDLMSMSTLVRLAGAKPIDESILTNSYFRINAYNEKDREARERIGSAVKSRMMAGGELTEDEVTGFAEAYMARGGKATGFNQWWMNQYKNATVTQAEQMSRRLDTPAARRMQEVMGGRDSMMDVDSFY